MKLSLSRSVCCTLLAVILFLRCGGASSKGEARQAKKYIINLDLPPDKRWTEVVTDHKIGIQNLVGVMQDFGVPDMLKNAVQELSENIDKYVPSPYNEEIVGIANLLDTRSVSGVLLANIYYELTAYGGQGVGASANQMACTSIVAESLNGTIMHGRNLDYGLVQFLDNITITVEFQKGGKTSYIGTTFAGYIGLLTGLKPYKYTISLDERNKGQLWMNVVEAWMSGLSAVASFHIRDALNRDDLSFKDAVWFMSLKPLIAASYVIMGGVQSGEGAVITRDRGGPANISMLSASDGKWYVLETNYDLWTTPPPSDDRRDAAIESMEAMTRANLTMSGLYNVLSTPPVLNKGTTYTVVMAAGNPDIYSTWIRYDVNKKT